MYLIFTYIISNFNAVFDSEKTAFVITEPPLIT
jgi:hypothetical protein